MIVKNEGHLVTPEGLSVIERCLHNVGHLVDAIAIVDTGSTDDTIALIQGWATGRSIPCRVVVDPWRDDFSYSRNRALQEGIDLTATLPGKTPWYAMFMDADNLAWADDGSTPISMDRDRLDADLYEVRMRQGSSQYSYVWMVRLDTSRRFQWYGPCHEYICPIKDADGKETWTPTRDRLDHGYIDSRREGSRSHDSRKYFRDALCFEKDLLVHPLDDRSLYYLGQSYRDAAKEVEADLARWEVLAQSESEEDRLAAQGRVAQLKAQVKTLNRRSEEAYLYRASMPPFNSWTDEYTYHAWVEAGKLRKLRKGQVDVVCLRYWMTAHQLRPHRLEAAYYILNYYLQEKAFRVGWEFARDLVRQPYPKDERIFVDEAIHRYLFAFEASLCAFYSEDRPTFVTLSKLVLRCPIVSEGVRSAAKSNLDKFSK